MNGHRAQAARACGRWVLPAAAALLLAGLPSEATGQDMPAARSRTLNGHDFIPSALLFDPFIVTFVKSTVGAGTMFDVVTEVPDPIAEGETLEFRGDVTFLGVGLGYQQALADWVAAYLDLAGGGRFGTSAESVISSGLNAYFNFALGAKFRLWRNRKFYLSANADYSSTGVSTVNVLRWAANVIDTGQISDSLLVAKNSSGSLRGGLNLAFAPAPWLGLTGVTLFGIGDAVGDLDAEFAFQGSLAADVDFGAITPVPIGLLLAFDSNSFTQEGGDITTAIRSFIWGIFYTGRDDFSIGLEFLHAKLPLRLADTDATGSSAQLNLRYWF